jgi:hypothetical protein
MAKMTVLEMTQDILSDMNSDEVNTVNATLESAQVAQIIKSTYFNIIEGKEFAHLKELFRLDSGTSARPTHMAIPETIIDVDWVKYNTETAAANKDLYTKMIYKTPEDFLYILEKRDSTDTTNIKVVTDPSNTLLNINKTKVPQYYTSFDDETIVMDGYIASLETNLQQSKTNCFGKRSVTFTISDSFVPDLPVQMFTYLLAEAKSTAFVILKQMANPKAEQTSVTQKRRMSQEAFKLKNGITYPNFGRK